jgi:hypothetical protein
MPNIIRPSSSAWPKTLVPPFFDRFSPFLTVFSLGPNRNSPEKSRARPFSRTVAADRKRRKRWKRRRPILAQVFAT